MSIVITGATGHLGRKVVEYLLARDVDPSTIVAADATRPHSARWHHRESGRHASTMRIPRRWMPRSPGRRRCSSSPEPRWASASPSTRQ